MLDRLEAIFRRIIGRAGNRDLPLWTLRRESSAFAVPNAVEWLVCASSGDRAELASVLAGLMRTIGPREWTRLYSSFRSPWIKPEDVSKLQRLTRDDAVEMLGVATLSANGHTREAATNALATLGHPRAVPYLLIRLGDWVPQVRVAAETALHRLMNTGIASELIEHHNLLVHLASVQRVDLTAMQSSIRDHLQAPCSLGELEAGLDHERATTRRYCMSLLLGRQDAQLDLVDRILQDPDPMIRRWFAFRVVRGDVQVAEGTLRRLLVDRASSVSTVVLRSLSDEQTVHFTQELIELSLADVRPVRESARWALKSRGWTHFAEEARSRISSKPRDGVAPGWVATLGETGTFATDYECVSELAHHPRSRVRAAAITALARLDKVRAARFVAEHLDDSSGLVRRSAIAALSDTPRREWQDTARKLVRSGTARGQVAALHLLALHSGWDTIPALLEAVLSDNPDLTDRAWQALCDWQRRHGTQRWLKPSEPCRRELSAVWPAIAAIEPPKWTGSTWEDLRATIDQHLREVGT